MWLAIELVSDERPSLQAQTTCREDVTPYEVSRERKRQIEAERQAMREEGAFRVDSPQKEPRSHRKTGKKPTGGPKRGTREAARRAGLDEKTAGDAERH